MYLGFYSVFGNGLTGFSSRNRDSDLKHAAWPAVPFASLSDTSATSPPPSSHRANLPPSPPRLAVNGITTSAPKSFMPTARSATEMSAETEKRKRELEEDQAMYPLLTSGGSSSSHGSSPVIPLSPDPFGRYPSTSDLGSSSQPMTYWGKEQRPGDAMAESSSSGAHERSQSTATSRFSLDSLNGAEAAPKSNRTTLMTVKSISKLWRKGPKNSVSSPTPPPIVTRPSQDAPSRRSQDRLETPTMTAPPHTPTFGRFSPQPPQPQSQPQPQPSPAPSRPDRPSQEQLAIPQPHQHQSQSHPPFPGKPGQGPIVAAQMLRGGAHLGFDRLHFDQESPYPIRRYSPQPPSHPEAAQPPPPPEKEKTGVRKSILKGWKGSSENNSPPIVPEPRSSPERPSANGARSRRPSVSHFGTSRGNATSPPPDIPPSPQIPEQFMQLRKTATSPPGAGGVVDHRQSVRSRMNSSSTDASTSPPQAQYPLGLGSSSSVRSVSPPSSRDSGETRPSFDVSQFEIVSPKMNATLSYPYRALDHD